MKRGITTKGARIFAFAAVLMLCAVSVLPAAARRQADTNILRIGVMPDIIAVPLFIAQERGYLGDNIHLEVFRSAPDRDAAMQTGNLDGSMSDLLALMTFRNGGFDVYATSKNYGRFGLAVNPNSGINSVSDLRGKKIGISINTIVEYMLDRILMDAGIDPSSVEKVAIPQIVSRLELLNSGQIDAALMPEPHVTTAEMNGNRVLVRSDDPNVDINAGVFMFTHASLQNKFHLIVQFYEAIDKAVDYMNSVSPDEFMPRIVSAIGFPESAVNVVLPKFDVYSLPPQGETQSAMNWLLGRGTIRAPYNYEDLVRRIRN